VGLTVIGHPEGQPWSNNHNAPFSFQPFLSS
jgi:hypothetical protein